jgi:phosphate transport system substrate-binding protein
MKRLVGVILITIIVIAFAIWTAQRKMPETEGGLTGTITMSGAWALYPMAVKWAEEFQKIHPGVRIDIAAGGAGKGMADALADVVDIGNVSREIYPEEAAKGAWWVSVTKDAVVSTANANNPLRDTLRKKGVTRETFITIWITGTITDWKDVVSLSGQTTSKCNLNVYTRSDACGAAGTWAEFLGKKQEDLLGVGVYGDPGLADAVKNDVLGIGFNNINFVYDAKTKCVVEGIMIVPMDLNANGVIDKNEDFYTTRDGIVQAIAAGDYPSPPARALHFVTHGKPAKKVVREFIRWVLTEGQRYVAEAGYINLTENKIRQELEKLGEE